MAKTKKVLNAAKANDIIITTKTNLLHKKHPNCKKVKGIIINLETRLRRSLTEKIHIFERELRALSKSKLLPKEILAGI